MLNKCREKQVCTDTIWYQRLEPSFLFNVYMKRFAQNFCFQESGWLLFLGQLSRLLDTDFPRMHCVNTLMWRHIIQKIPGYCKFNVLFIWLKIAAVSAWNSKFQISCFLCLKTLEVYTLQYILTLIARSYGEWDQLWQSK